MISDMRASHMIRTRNGPLQSFAKLPALLDEIHFYGATPLVTNVLCEKLLSAMLEWLESDEVSKELVTVKSNVKKKLYAGRIENYFFIAAVLDTL